MRVFITAGEASGDKLGTALMAGLKELVPDVTFRGVGGEGMMAEGLDSLFPMDDIAVMGIVEILKEYRFLKSRIRETAEAIIAEKPDVLITIDAPEFSLRVSRMVKAVSDIRVVHYVAPTVWAWRPKRAQKMAAHVDQVLALLPFEPPYMEQAGMQCDFVGHPVVTDPLATDEQATRFRSDHGLVGPFAVVLPGSRRSEVGRLMPTFKIVAEELARTRPDLKLVIPAAKHLVEAIEDEVKTWPNRPVVIDPRKDEDGIAKRAAFKAADVALAASGTVSLELAAAGTPMVIAYDMGWLSRQIIGRMLLVDTVTLVNLVSESRVVPEFINKDCEPLPIARAIEDVLSNPDAQAEAMAQTMQRLGQGGDHPGLRAARAVLARLPTGNTQH